MGGTFAAVLCRFDLLEIALAATTELGARQAKLLALVGRANEQVLAGELRANESRLRPARRKLGKALRTMAVFRKRLARAVRAGVPPAVVAALDLTAAGLVEDLRTLRSSF